MSPQQKDAVFCLIISGLSVAAFLILLYFQNIRVAFSAFAILGLYGLAPLLFYRKGRKKVLIDERDVEIGKKAGVFGFKLFWVAFALAAVIVLQIKDWNSSIPIIYMCYPVFFGWILISSARAIKILLLYRQSRGR